MGIGKSKSNKYNLLRPVQEQKNAGVVPIFLIAILMILTLFLFYKTYRLEQKISNIPQFIFLDIEQIGDIPSDEFEIVLSKVKSLSQAGYVISTNNRILAAPDYMKLSIKELKNERNE